MREVPFLRSDAVSDNDSAINFGNQETAWKISQESAQQLAWVWFGKGTLLNVANGLQICLRCKPNVRGIQAGSDQMMRIDELVLCS
jgi:hypothetical protein